MGKLVLPESVKTVHARLDLGLSMDGEPFPLILGRNEVAILLAFYWLCIIELAAGVNETYFGLWRKTDSNPQGTVGWVGYSPLADMIWNATYQVNFVTESVKNADHGYIVLPQPLVLIRPPRLLGYRVLATSAQLEMRLFYVTRTVSDTQLAGLMVKDHA